MRKIVLILLLAMLTMALSGCLSVMPIGRGGTGISVRGVGDMVTHQIDTDNFSGINVNGIFTVRYHQAPQASVVLEIQENLYEFVRIETRSGILRVNSTRSFEVDLQEGSLMPILHIYAPYLSSIDLNGMAVTEDWDILVTSNLRISVNGMSYLNFTGTIERLEVSANGMSNVTMEGHAVSATVTANGMSNVDVYVTDSIDATAHGMSSITYRGNPGTVRETTSGMSNITSR